MNPFSQYQYRCISCNHELIVPLPACETCGPGTSGFYTFDETTKKIKLVCQNCLQPHFSGSTTPLNCPICITGYCDWWDNKKNTWLELKLDTKDLNNNEIWIEGDFDGDYEADIAPEFNIGNTSSIHQSFFHVEIKHSYLKNIRKVNGPPLSVTQREKRPFTFPLISPVDVEVKESNSDSSFNRVALKDFRLHDWTLVATMTSSDHGHNKRFGRIKGTAYGVLAEIDEKQVKTPARISSWGKNSDSETEQKMIQSEEEHISTDELMPNNEEVALEESIETDDCFACNFLLHIIGFFLIWLACNFKTALLFAIFLSGFCWLSEKLIEHNLTIKKTWLKILISGGILIASIGALTIGYWPTFITDCIKLSEYAVLACAAALLISAFLRYCFIKFILVICLFLALSSWCKINDRDCKFTPQTNSAVTSIQSLYQQYQILTDNDVNSEILNDSSINNPNGRYLSLNEASNNPDLLNDCKNRVYIPFGFDQDQLDDSTKIKLDRLGQIMKKFEDSRVIISGFSSLDAGDATPEGNLRNIALSQRRTEAIRDYLVSNDYIDSLNIEVRAYGSNVPILQNKPSSNINRRVEVNLQCK